MSRLSCAVADCPREAHTRGWCQMHYKRWWRGDSLEPQLESLPIYAPFGTMIYDDSDDRGRAICHFCGRPYVQVGTHAFQAHGITSDEYRERTGLSERFSLSSKEWSQRKSKEMQRRRADGDPTLMDPNEVRPSAEEVSTLQRDRPQRASEVAARVEGLHRHWANQLNRYPSPRFQRTNVATEGIECLNCGVLFTPIDSYEGASGRIMWAASNRKTCSPLCRDEHLASQGLELGPNGSPRFTSESSKQPWFEVGLQKARVTRLRRTEQKKAATPHGTRNKYRYGCRCDACRAANTAHGREMKKRRQATLP